MSERDADTRRAVNAAKIIFDGRDNLGEVMVTLEHVVGVVLMAVMNRDTQKAVRMLNAGLVPGVEQRLAFAAAKKDQPHD